MALLARHNDCFDYFVGDAHAGHRYGSRRIMDVRRKSALWVPRTKIGETNQAARNLCSSRYLQHIFLGED